MAVRRIHFKGQCCIADLDAVPGYQRALKDASAIAVGAIGGAEILEVKLMVIIHDSAVDAREEGIMNLKLGFGQTTDHKRFISGFQGLFGAIRLFVNEHGHKANPKTT